LQIKVLKRYADTVQLGEIRRWDTSTPAAVALREKELLRL